MLEVSEQDVEEMGIRLREISLNEDIAEADRLTVLETIADERKNQEELLGESLVAAKFSYSYFYRQANAALPAKKMPGKPGIKTKHHLQDPSFSACIG